MGLVLPQAVIAAQKQNPVPTAMPATNGYKGPRSMDEVVKQFPYLYDGYSQSVNSGNWKTQWGGFDQWFTETMARNPNTPESRYFTTGVLPEGMSEPEEEVAYEKGFFDLVDQDYIQPDLQKDKERRAEADALLAKYGPQLDAARRTIGSLMPTVDTAAYFAANPDAKAAFDQLQAGTGTKPTAEQFVEQHYNTVGKAAGAASPYAKSALLEEELANNTAARDAQLASLAEQITGRNANLTTLLTSLKSNLSAELATKADALQAQLDALDSGLTTYTAAERAALANQLESNFNSLAAEVEAKKKGLADELASLGTALDANSAARKTALETELAALNAAQEPLNAIRLEGAQTLAAAVNLGVENKLDQITADAAQDGFIGSSTGTEQALLRASISGRQEAAAAVGDARTANATDVASIARYGATEGRTLADQIAQSRLDLSTYGADQTRTLGDYDATGKRTITDVGAADERKIASNDATGRFDLTKFGSEEKRKLSDYGSTETRGIADWGANETRTLGDFNADQTRGIKDSAAQRQLGYFDNDITRRIAALSAPTQALNAEFALRGAADDYSQSGLRRAMNNLSFFQLGQGVENGPTIPGSPVLDAEGSAWQNIGAGLLSVAGGIGQSKNWWTSTPKTDTGHTTVPESGS